MEKHLAEWVCNLREKQHLFDGTSPNVATRHARWTFKADRVLFDLAIDRVRQMDDKHFALKVNLRDLRPPEVLDSFAHREGADAWEADADVELSAAIVLHRMRIDAVRLETARDNDELIVDGRDILTLLTLPVRLDDLLLQLQRLAQSELQRWHVVFGMNLAIEVAEFIWKGKSKEAL